MKKITLSLFSALLSVGYGYSQVTATVTAPPYNGATTQVRAPNGNSSHAGMRGCFYISAAEMSGFSTTNSIINGFGFALAQGTSVNAVTGGFTLYVQNTPDASYLKGTNWPTAITSMSTVYNGLMTVPATNNQAQIMLPITQFTYTGGGLYVAYDWASPGPFDANVATYFASNALALGGATADTPTLPSPTTMTNSGFRPAFLWTAANTVTNDIQVSNVYAPGKVAFLLNTPHLVQALVRNGSNQARTNVQVGLGVTGANIFGATTSIPSLAAGATSVVTFPFNPQIQGINTISVGVNADQNNTNNSGTWSQSVTCITAGAHPPQATYTLGIGFASSTGNIVTRLVQPANSSITGVNLAISNNTSAIGSPVYGVLLNSTGVIVATTNTVTATAGMLGTYQYFSFTTPQAVTAGSTYYIGMGLSNAGAYPIGGQTNTGFAIPSGLYYTTPLIGGTPVQQANSWFLGIEPVYGPTGALISVTQNSAVSCAGQPISLTASGMSNFSWAGTPTSTTGATIGDAPTVTTTYTVTGTTSTVSGCPNLTNSAIITHSVVSLAITAAPSKTLICKGKTVILTATGGAATYSWSGISGTNAVNTVTLNNVGNNTYTVYGTEATLGCRSNTVAVTVSVSACTGISVNGINSGDINIFPNPAVSGKSQIIGLTGLNTITVYNLLGQAVMSTQTEKETFELDFSNQPNGTYIVKILDANNDAKTVKIVNQN